MGAMGGFFITDRGRALQAKAQIGRPLTYTKVQAGDGSLSGQSIPTLIGLISPKLTMSINSLKTQSNGKATLSVVLSNQNLSSGFYLREMGVFAQDPDVGEILYCYANAASVAEYIPPRGAADIVEQKYNINTIVGNAANISAVIDNSLVYVTRQELIDKTGVLTNLQTTDKSNLVGAINELFQNVSDGKGVLADAITDKGVPTSASATFQQMADNIGEIETDKTGDATAEARDILLGKTAYSKGEKLTGTLEQAAGTILGNAVGYDPGMGAIYVEIDGPSAGNVENLVITTDAVGSPPIGFPTQIEVLDAAVKPANIKKGVTMLGIPGSFTEDATANTADILTGKTAYVNGMKFTGTMPNRDRNSQIPRLMNDEPIPIGYYQNSYVPSMFRYIQNITIPSGGSVTQSVHSDYRVAGAIVWADAGGVNGILGGVCLTNDYLKVEGSDPIHNTSQLSPGLIITPRMNGQNTCVFTYTPAGGITFSAYIIIERK